MKRTTLSDAQRKVLKHRRRLKKKRRKQRANEDVIPDKAHDRNDPELQAAPQQKAERSNVTTAIDLNAMDTKDEHLLAQFSNVFQFFKPKEEQAEKPISLKVAEKDSMTVQNVTEGASTNSPTVSKKKLKKRKRPTMDDLKKEVRHPEVIEMWDVAALDPVLLATLKSYRNTVQVPSHWRHKRRYLYAKKASSKPRFELPDHIKDTGVADMREAMKEKTIAVSLKGKMRQRREFTVGRYSVDYQKLHDAFFLLQGTPRLTLHGDLYYEGKESDMKRRAMRPGVLSDELRAALAMTPSKPPPYLMQMQRYGPPPSYPHLKIPGLNAPLPKGCEWGYHAEGWGYPPLDEWNRPIYGDVFAVMTAKSIPESILPIDRARWGEIENDLDNQESGIQKEEEEEGDEESDEESDENTNNPVTIDEDFLIEGLGPPPDEIQLTK